MRVGWLLVILSSFAATAASAQEIGEVDSSNDADARTAFEAGSTAFDEGRFEYALERFSHAHALTGRPELLYNMGLTLERLQRPSEALEALESYLSAVPNSPNRGNVEGRIVALRGAVAERRALEEELAASRAAESAEENPDPIVVLNDPPEGEARVRTKWWLWAIVGIVVVGVGVGVAVALTRDDDVQQPLPGDEGVVVSTLTEW